MSDTNAQAMQDVKATYPGQLQGIHYNGSQYTDDQRHNAVIVFLTLGNVNKVSQAIGIPQRTLYDWTKQEWWLDLITRYREEKRQELDANFTRIVESCSQTIEKQLEIGAVSARDAATILGITFDKRQILNLQPTTISGKSIDISKLQGDFERFLAAKEINSAVDYLNESD